MSIRTRVMFFRDNQIMRVPSRRFEALCAGDPSLVMPEFAGQRVRCAIAYVDVVMRRPAGVAQIDYILIPFGLDGRLDLEARQQGDRLAFEAAGRSLVTLSEPVVEFGPYLAGRRYRAEFKWTPTADQVQAVVDMALAG